MFRLYSNCHLTPQAIENLDDRWKEARHISDSSFLVHPESETINTWATKKTELPLHFPGSFEQTLQLIYNLRITYPDDPIYLGDDDVTNAFKWIKNNPSIVAMCGFTSHEHAIVGFCTGQNFGNCWSPSNFEIIAVARQMWAQYLWLHQPKEAMDRAAPFAKKMSIADPISNDPPVKAQKDALNPGVKDSHGNRLPPWYDMQVNNCMFADILKYIIRTATMSIIALKDLSGAAQPFQEHPLSFKK